MSEQIEQPKEQLNPAEIYRLAAEIYEELPEGQKLAVIEALCNMVERTAIPVFVLKAHALGLSPKEEHNDISDWSHKWSYLTNML